jgi:hypothetical protein
LQGPEDASRRSAEPVPFRPLPVEPLPSASGGTSRQRRGRAIERVVGILLGICLGIAVVAAFVFLGSEGTIDAPRIAGVAEQPRPGLPLPSGSPIPVVRVIGGAPPASGPVHLRATRGERVRFRVVTDVPVGIEIPGYGVNEIVDSGQKVSFRAARTGQFPVIVSASHIAIATVEVTR